MEKAFDLTQLHVRVAPSALKWLRDMSAQAYGSDRRVGRFIEHLVFREMERERREREALTEAMLSLKRGE